MSLDELIADHKAMYEQDVRIERLTVRQPPVTVDVQSGERHQEDGSMLGMTLSGRLLRYLSHPEGYGDAFPWSRALWMLRVECRRSHPYHRGPTVPYWRGSLCHQFVTFCVIRGWSVADAARILRYDNPEPVLRYALAYIESEMDVQRDRAERRARDDAGRGPGAIPEPVISHRPLDGLHREECPQCRRAGVA